MKHTIEYILVKALFFIARVIPFSAALRFGGALGRTVARIYPYRRQVVMTNLRAAFPDKPEAERERICRGMYEHLGIMLFEYLTTFRQPREKILEMVTFEPPDLLRDTYERGGGVIGVTGHFGSFELLGAAVAASGIPIYGVAKAMKNPKVDRFLNHIRAENGLHVINKKKGIGPVVESIHNKHFVVLVADQDAGSRGTKVRFLGIESSTPVGPAVSVIRTGAPVIALFIVREEIGRYRAYFHEVPTGGLPEDTDEKIREFTARYTRLLEQYIRKHPEQYLWLHKRWKTAGIYDSGSPFARESAETAGTTAS